MLYSPNWDKQSETKVDPFKLETLIAWLEKQPGDRRYDYTCSGRCLLAQYFTAMGFEDINVQPGFFFTKKDSATYEFPRTFERVAIEDKLTFGAALLRARAALAGA